MAAEHLKLGADGEAVASAYLTALGYDVRERNVRFGRQEIDIVAFDPFERMIVFVEVKTRSHASQQYPIELSVDWRKRRSLKKAIAQWVLKHAYEGPGRIDVLCVCNGTVTKHLINIGTEHY